MRLTPGIQRNIFKALVLLTVVAWILGAILRTGRTVHADQSASISGKTIQLGAARRGALYAVAVSLKNPAQIKGTTPCASP